MVIRATIIACLVLFVCSLSIAQKTDTKLFDRVMTDLEAGRTEEALKALDEVIKQYPKHADAYFLRGSLRCRRIPHKR